MAAPVDSARPQRQQSRRNPLRRTAGVSGPVSTTAESVYGPVYRRLTAGIVCSVFVVAFEAIGVATAFPVIARDLDGFGLYALGFSGFLTTSLFAMVVAGQICDRRGPRVPFLLSGALFSVGLVASGAAPTMAGLVAGRALQGLGAGLHIVSVYVIIARAYPESMRPRMFAALSSAWVLPSVIGPGVAGWLADSLSWRLVFLGVLPAVLPALALVAPRLPALETARLSSGEAQSGPARRVQPWATRTTWAALAAAVGAALLQYAGQRISVVGLAVAAGGAALLVPALPRLLPPGTLRAARGLPASVLMRGLLAGAFFGAEVFVPLMLTQERGLTTTLAGFSLTGAALSWAGGSWFQGRTGLRLPRPVLVRSGALLVAVGIVLVAGALAPFTPVALAALGWTVAGLGMGLSVSSLSVLVLEHSPAGDAGASSAALQVCDVVGSIVCIGAAGALFAALHSGQSAPSGSGGDRPVFLAIWTAMAAVAGIAAVLAPRVAAPRPRVRT